MEDAEVAGEAVLPGLLAACAPEERTQSPESHDGRGDARKSRSRDGAVDFAAADEKVAAGGGGGRGCRRLAALAVASEGSAQAGEGGSAAAAAAAAVGGETGRVARRWEG